MADTSAALSAPRSAEVLGDNEGFAGNVVITSQYTAFNFLFKNLFKQFHIPSNCYFFGICVLQSIRAISITYGVPTTALPLMFVLFVTACKDAFEDYNRHKADQVENTRPTTIVSSSQATETKPWKDVVVGEIVLIKNREQIPADVVVLASSDPDGLCYVMTANLDGETNLKLRRVANDIMDSDLLPRSKPNNETPAPVAQAAALKCRLAYESPNKFLERFEGTATFTTAAGKDTYALGPKNVLLRGTQLRNTNWVLGAVIYTGVESKIMMNMTKSAFKRSSLIKTSGTLTFQILATQIFVCAIAAIAGSTNLRQDVVQNNKFLWGDGLQYNNLHDVPAPPDPGAEGVLLFFTYVLVFTNYIPISLMVSLDVVRLAQAAMINLDRQMYWFEEGVGGQPSFQFPALVRSSDLNEELGEVEHIFSDKTGTLTCNIMEFRKCIVGGVSYGRGSTGYALKPTSAAEDASNAIDEAALLVDRGDGLAECKSPNVQFRDPALWAALKSQGDGGAADQRARAEEFFQHLAVNHDVMAEHEKGAEPCYSASSPDEGALVQVRDTPSTLKHANAVSWCR
jgi:phospholipid-translocating P-type ATPase (flippase)